MRDGARDHVFEQLLVNPEGAGNRRTRLNFDRDDNPAFERVDDQLILAGTWSVGRTRVLRAVDRQQHRF